jgi:hypothetical protein
VHDREGIIAFVWGVCGRRNILNSETRKQILGVEERWGEIENRNRGVEAGTKKQKICPLFAERWETRQKRAVQP